MKPEKIAENINTLADFCGMRDLKALTPDALYQTYGIHKADILILFGGSIPAGCDTAALGILSGVADKLMIVGGEGHTTDSLRQKIHEKHPGIAVQNRSEADIMRDYITLQYGMQDIILERHSTNCGNNITNALAVLKEHHIHAGDMIIIQDATMQRRMNAGFARHAPNIHIINYAAYSNRVIADQESLRFEHEDLWGMWDMDTYITLLMGEIPRLRNTPDGYGPNGKNFIAEVVIPPAVSQAFEELNAQYPSKIRPANPRYASLS
ncbi:MAG: YdcF family protein [Clostridiales bacterium]|nr:YdcF family protein [Clostridiales bacterium]